MLLEKFAERKIRCNIVAPGALDTDFGGGRTDEMRRRFGEATAMGRMGQAEDIGPLIAALLSEEFRWVDGQRIEANGGHLQPIGPIARELGGNHTRRYT